MDTHYDIVKASSVGSTQDVAGEQFAATGVPSLVIADRQVAGRGRSSRQWLEPTVAMFSSFAFRPQWDPGEFGVIPLCAGVAVRRAIGEPFVDLKWPNDLLVDGLKVGGILVESADGVVIVGCGLNLWWADPPAYASSLLDTAPPPDQATALATAWVDELVAMLARPGTQWPADEYRSACVTIGSRVRWDGGEGIARDVGADGALEVEGADGLVNVISGDVHLLSGG